MNKGREKLSTDELVGKAFYYLNSFKRHRALANIEKSGGNYEEFLKNELKQFQFFDNLELTLRALQKEIRGEKDED
jgi:hypothetical protein